MAIFRLQVTSITRDGGHGSVAAAAYRAGEKLRDDRTNQLHNHTRRKDVTHSEILLPAHLSGQNMDWALNRASLWNSAEQAETRKNARVAKEIQVTLPHELPAERRIELARTFSQEISDNYRVAVDLAVHDPRPSGDPRNYHAHLLLTTREISAGGLRAKAGLDMSSAERARLGLPNLSQEFTALRERWASLTNEALKAANIEARVDHRSLADQGIDREPRPHIPFAALKIERAGKYSDVAASIRADYDLRVRERQERSVQRGAETATDHAASPSAENSAADHQAAGPHAAPRSPEDIRREARENWLRMRAARGGRTTEVGHEVRNARTPYDDHQP